MHVHVDTLPELVAGLVELGHVGAVTPPLMLHPTPPDAPGPGAGSPFGPVAVAVKVTCCPGVGLAGDALTVTEGPAGGTSVGLVMTVLRVSDTLLGAVAFSVSISTPESSSLGLVRHAAWAPLGSKIWPWSSNDALFHQVTDDICTT